MILPRDLMLQRSLCNMATMCAAFMAVTQSSSFVVVFLWYGVATTSILPKSIGLFCSRALPK